MSLPSFNTTLSLLDKACILATALGPIALAKKLAVDAVQLHNSHLLRLSISLDSILPGERLSDPATYANFMTRIYQDNPELKVTASRDRIANTLIEAYPGPTGQMLKLVPERDLLKIFPVINVDTNLDTKKIVDQALHHYQYQHMLDAYQRIAPHLPLLTETETPGIHRMAIAAVGDRSMTPNNSPVYHLPRQDPQFDSLRGSVTTIHQRYEAIAQEFRADTHKFTLSYAGAAPTVIRPSTHLYDGSPSPQHERELNTLFDATLRPFYAHMNLGQTLQQGCYIQGEVPIDGLPPVPQQVRTISVTPSEEEQVSVAHFTYEQYRRAHQGFEPTPLDQIPESDTKGPVTFAARFAPQNDDMFFIHHAMAITGAVGTNVINALDEIDYVFGTKFANGYLWLLPLVQCLSSASSMIAANNDISRVELLKGMLITSGFLIVQKVSYLAMLHLGQKPEQLNPEAEKSFGDFVTKYGTPIAWNTAIPVSMALLVAQFGTSPFAGTAALTIPALLGFTKSTAMSMNQYYNVDNSDLSDAASATKTAINLICVGAALYPILRTAPVYGDSISYSTHIISKLFAIFVTAVNTYSLMDTITSGAAHLWTANLADEQELLVDIETNDADTTNSDTHNSDDAHLEL